MSIELEFIKKIDKLIPRPEIALEVLKTANESECSIPALSKIIKQDPSLMANMLKLANSAYFGHMQEINSITDIIVRLGIDTVKMLAITSASVGVLNSPQQAYNLEPGFLWKHSYACAMLSSIIGKWAKYTAVSTLYTSALLHDVGKIILNRPLQIESMNRGEELDPKSSILELEQFLLHTNHAKVGAVLLKEWGLPADIVSPVESHHNLKACGNSLNNQIVYLANYLTESMGIKASTPDSYFFTVEEDFSANKDLPNIPSFKENMESIIYEFYEKFNDTSTLQFS
nr:HDOD domain-containing protein [Desulfobulbaceae bacterium]